MIRNPSPPSTATAKTAVGFAGGTLFGPVRDDGLSFLDKGPLRSGFRGTADPTAARSIGQGAENFGSAVTGGAFDALTAREGEHLFTGQPLTPPEQKSAQNAAILGAAMAFIPYDELAKVAKLFKFGDEGARAVSKLDGANDLRRTGTVASNAALETARKRAVAQAWRQEQELVRRTGRGTVDWTDNQVSELLQNGKVSGYEGHHINSVKNHPELAGNPNNVEFVSGRAENLNRHGGNFRNPTSGPLLDRGSP